MAESNHLEQISVFKEIREDLQVGINSSKICLGSCDHGCSNSVVLSQQQLLDLSESSGMCWLLCGLGWSWVPVGWLFGGPSAVLPVGMGCNDGNSDKWREENHVVVGKGKASPSSRINSPLGAVMSAWGTLAVLSGLSCSSFPWKSLLSQGSVLTSSVIQQLTLAWHHEGLSTTQRFFSHLLC